MQVDTINSHLEKIKKIYFFRSFTVVKDDEKLFYKKGDVLTRGSASKEFIVGVYCLYHTWLIA